MHYENILILHEQNFIQDFKNFITFKTKTYPKIVLSNF